MLTNSEEYKNLKSKIAEFLNVDANLIYSIVNPLRKKSKNRLVWLVVVKGSSNVILREKDGLLSIIN